MSANISQARRYREMVRFEFKRCPPPPDSNPDKAFRIHLEALYEQEKKQLLSLVDENASESEIRNRKAGLFLISVGLFTYGRLDVAEDILTGIPGGKGQIRRLTWVMSVLLPLPEKLDALTQPDLVSEWLKMNRSKLRWNENSQTYILEN